MAKARARKASPKAKSPGGRDTAKGRARANANPKHGKKSNAGTTVPKKARKRVKPVPALPPTPKLTGKRKKAYSRSIDRERLKNEREAEIVSAFESAVGKRGVAEKDIRRLFQQALKKQRRMRSEQARLRKDIYVRAEKLTPYQKRLERAYFYGWTKEQATGKAREHGQIPVSELPKDSHRSDHKRRRDFRHELFTKYGSVQAMADYFESIGLSRSEAFSLWWSP